MASQRNESKQVLMDSLANVKDLIQAEAFGDALALGALLGAQLQLLIDYDNAEARLIVDPPARDQALAELHNRNYPSEAKVTP